MICLLPIFVTKFEYHYAKVSDYHEKYDFEQVSSIPNVFQIVPHKTYGLIYRIKQSSQDKQKVRNVPAKQGWTLEKKQDQNWDKYRVADMEEVGIFSSSFNIEHEDSKIKIPIPLTEVIKN